MAKLHFLITAGGTREHIDPVRFISNASSGKMGYALARAVLKRGHKVTLITAPISLAPVKNAKMINVETAAEMFRAVKQNFDKCDCLIMAAAVADYTPAKTSKTKIKKDFAAMSIELKPTKDILKWAGKSKSDQFVAGFALEDKAVRKNAEEKLLNKNLDMIIANTPAAISAESSSVQIKTPDTNWQTLPKAPKQTTASRIAKQILDAIE